MFYLKACPRCKGDVHPDRDSYGSFHKCLQCGRIFEADRRPSGASKLKPDKLAA